jgi:hypothetical protein
LLPGIDDGAKLLKIHKLTRALQNWVSEFITTPIIQHVWDNTHEQILENQSITVSALEKILLRRFMLQPNI